MSLLPGTSFVVVHNVWMLAVDVGAIRQLHRCRGPPSPRRGPPFSLWVTLSEWIQTLPVCISEGDDSDRHHTKPFE
jgi:hypothetical protein